ncbi:hypothetical protein SDC9_174170 [bioreactor metagenome]|uniref:Uncharacterized protein n=1 Tax=bioreactor metagenome TaxID=1076179 RepID=A0A645GJ58_9ZZZZ
MFANERERGHSQHVHRVADDRQQPIPLGLVRELAKHKPQRVANQLAKAGDEPDGRRGRAEQREVRPADARGALVRHVR